jgi:hypothetical protein
VITEDAGVDHLVVAIPVFGNVAATTVAPPVVVPLGLVVFGEHRDLDRGSRSVSGGFGVDLALPTVEIAAFAIIRLGYLTALLPLGGDRGGCGTRSSGVATITRNLDSTRWWGHGVDRVATGQGSSG